MKLGVSIKIDVTKIDKSLLYKGAKGAYLDATVFIDSVQDKYGNNGMVTQDVSKEAKSAGEKGPILGNVKVFWKEDGKEDGKVAKPSKSKGDDFDDDIPF